MHQVVQSMTVQLVAATKKQNPTFNTIPLTLVPILRGALPMYVASSQHFTAPFCVLVVFTTVKKKTLNKHGHMVSLDTVIATGGTILTICDELMALSSSAERFVTFLSCYVSPKGLAAVAKHPLVRKVIVAATAEGVDENGYVVQYPGDVGDRLF
ncbi:hypothetical protein DM02DRAFT_662328 [Periconia macrospinosa]|uniref:Phosphoribosyltransferase domain-containing protein n=1 Tax=Periconia macrospinosa TaxID=97972 RepID=A0A2V1D685_9PLEO|nr:hypothetical protein DM02DRAFT_662328 [Periconia macrospinosa]